MSLTNSSDPTFDIQWNSFYEHSDFSTDSSHNGRYQFSLQYIGTAADDPTVEDLIGDFSVDPDLPDTRATWHRNYTSLAPWIKAHVLKQAMGWNGEKQLADHFEEHPTLAVEYGFVDDDPTTQPETVRSNPPAQSRLWEMWHEEFSDDLRDICHDIAKELVELAREEDIPAPDDVPEAASPLSPAFNKGHKWLSSRNLMGRTKKMSLQT